jgi:hypothetical protein
MRLSCGVARFAAVIRCGLSPNQNCEVEVGVEFVAPRQGRVLGSESFQETMGRTLGGIDAPGRLLDHRHGRLAVKLFSQLNGSITCPRGRSGASIT